MKLWQPDDYLGRHLPVAGADWRGGATDDLQYQVLHASRLQQATIATNSTDQQKPILTTMATRATKEKATNK